MKEHPDYFEPDISDQVTAKVSEMLSNPDFITDGSFSDAWNRDVETITASEILLALLIKTDVNQLPFALIPALEEFRVPVMKSLEDTARIIIEKGEA